MGGSPLLRGYVGHGRPRPAGGFLAEPILDLEARSLVSTKLNCVVCYENCPVCQGGGSDRRVTLETCQKRSLDRAFAPSRVKLRRGPIVGKNSQRRGSEAPQPDLGSASSRSVDPDPRFVPANGCCCRPARVQRFGNPRNKVRVGLRSSRMRQMVRIEEVDHLRDRRLRRSMAARTRSPCAVPHMASIAADNCAPASQCFQV